MSPSKTSWRVNERGEHRLSRPPCPRNTARARSSRSAQLLGRALEAHLALLEEHGAVGDRQRHVQRLLDDDDRHALAPSAARRPASSSCTTIGDRPSDSSSMSSTSGSCSSVMASASICCWPPDSDAGQLRPGGRRASGNRSSTRAIRRVAVRGVAAVDVGAHLEVLADRHLREHALAAGQQVDAVLHALLGRDVGDRRAVQPHDAARRRAEPGDDAQDRRLARAVRAEQREHLAPLHLEADVEQDLDVAVGEVDVVDLDRRDVLGVGLLALGARRAPRGARRRRARGRS